MNDLDIHQIAQDIADVMRWQYVEHDGWNAKIENAATQASLWIAEEAGRVRISGNFGDLYNYLRYERRGKNQITVSAKKTPPEMVSDIRRRLLPDYLKDLEYVKQCRADHLKRMEQIKQTAQYFAAILNVQTPEVSEDECARIHLGFIKRLWGHVEVSLDSVKIQLDNVPFNVAATALVPLGEYIKAAEQEEAQEGESDAD